MRVAEGEGFCQEISEHESSGQARISRAFLGQPFVSLNNVNVIATTSDFRDAFEF